MSKNTYRHLLNRRMSGGRPGSQKFCYVMFVLTTEIQLTMWLGRNDEHTIITMVQKLVTAQTSNQSLMSVQRLQRCRCECSGKRTTSADSVVIGRQIGRIQISTGHFAGRFRWRQRRRSGWRMSTAQWWTDARSDRTSQCRVGGTVTIDAVRFRVTSNGSVGSNVQKIVRTTRHRVGTATTGERATNSRLT